MKKITYMAAASLACCMVASATSITVANHDFGSSAKKVIGFSENVAGWSDIGTSFSGSGVEKKGANGGIAYVRNTDDGAYQILDYAMVAGETYVLTWEDWQSFKGTEETVTLRSADKTKAQFRQTTELATLVSKVTSTWASRSLSYTATATDAGKYLVISFHNTSSGGKSWVAWDNFAVDAVQESAGSSSGAPAKATVSSAASITVVNHDFGPATKKVIGFSKNVAGWSDIGTSFSGSGVEKKGANGGIAYVRNTDDGAYQILDYAMVAGETYVLTWEDWQSLKGTEETVTLRSAKKTKAQFSQTTELATLVSKVTSTWKSKSLSYTATAADAGKYLVISFNNTSSGGKSWIALDNFAVDAVPAGSAVPADLYPSKDLIVPTHTEWTRGHYPKRIVEFRKHPLATHDIVFIGDSITENGGNWAERFNIKTIKNRGIKGDTTAGVLERMNELYHYKPKALFILIGINDLRKSKQSPEYVARNTIRISDLMRENSPSTKVYVQTILPNSEKQGNLVRIQTVNRLLAEQVNPSYTLIDLYSHFVDEADHIKSEYTVDGLHLSPAGYTLWVSLVQKL